MCQQHLFFAAMNKRDGKVILWPTAEYASLKAQQGHGLGRSAEDKS
jgi:hypothetical protein